MDDDKLRSELEDLRKKEIRLRKSVGTDKDDPQENGAGSSRALRYTWLGAEFAAIFFAFIWAGQYLDKTLGTKPWLLLMGICLGFALALYRLIFVARKLSE